MRDVIVEVAVAVIPCVGIRKSVYKLRVRNCAQNFLIEEVERLVHGSFKSLKQLCWIRSVFLKEVLAKGGAEVRIVSAPPGLFKGPALQSKAGTSIGPQAMSHEDCEAVSVKHSREDLRKGSSRKGSYDIYICI